MFVCMMIHRKMYDDVEGIGLRNFEEGCLELKDMSNYIGDRGVSSSHSQIYQVCQSFFIKAGSTILGDNFPDNA